MDEADEARVIFQYPPVSSHASYTVCQFRNAFFCNFMVISQVMITAGDRARLEPGIYLNDNLADFHFKVHFALRPQSCQDAPPQQCSSEGPPQWGRRRT